MPTTHELRQPTRSRAVMALLASAQLIVAVDFDIVFVALPEIGRDLGFTPQSLQWVVSAYTVALGGCLLLGGRAADRLGGRGVFLAGAAIFGVTSLAGGLATVPEVLVTARAVQGFGAALLIPSSLKLINVSFAEGPARTRALAVWGIAGSSGAAVGALGGGVLTGFFGWEWVLHVNVPFTLIAVTAGIALLPDDHAPSARGFDLPGAALATAGSTLVVFGLVNGPESDWASFGGIGCLALGIALLAAFFALERRTSDALVPLRLFANRHLAVAVVVAFLFMSAIATQYYLFTTYLQDVLGYGPLATGFGFLPLSLLSMVGSGVVFPRVLNRWGLRTALSLGMAGFGLSMAIIATCMSADGSYWALLPGMVVWALFAGLGFPPIFLAASTGTGAEEQGVAGALASTSQYIGGAVGLAVLVGIANSVAEGATHLAGLRAAGWTGTVFVIAGTCAALSLPRLSGKGSTS